MVWVKVIVKPVTHMAVLMRETGLQTVPRTMPQTSHKLFTDKKMGQEFSPTFQGYRSPSTMALIPWTTNSSGTKAVPQQNCESVCQYMATLNSELCLWGGV